MLLAGAMVFGLVACGSNTDTATTGDAATGGDTTEQTTAAADGSVLNIYCWNEEFKSRVTDHYPGYEATGDNEGKIGDVTVKWNITPNENNAYQQNLDETLLKQADAAANDKIDLFLVEADYALKYVDTDYTMPVADLGITEDELANQYQYTKDVMTDSNGVLKGLSWQGCPGTFIYNREAAKEVLGSDDPADVQAAVSDWNKFADTAAKMQAAGYKMTATANDTYRVFSNNVSGKWVQDGKIVVDDNVKKWADDSKALVDAGMTTTNDMWSDDWSKGFQAPGDVFCYFGPAWLINFSMGADPSKEDDGSIAHAGGWGLVNGPQGFYWGGTWICAAQGTDNPDIVKDIILNMTTNDDIMKDIAVKDSDCVNNKDVLNALATDETFGNAILGGQNPYQMLSDGAEKIDLSNLSEYDQACVEEYQNAMKNFFDGNATYDEALAQFMTAVGEKHPELAQ
jgi:hypothetical protein